MTIEQFRASFVAARPGLRGNQLVAEEVAAALRRHACVGSDSALGDDSMRCIVELANCDVRQTDDLGSDAGGAEAMLLPHERGGFWVLVDPRPSGGWKAVGPERQASLRRRLRFRVLHEVAHTLFYDVEDGRTPRRRAPVTEAEELFCDRLAAALLLPPSIVRASPARAAAAYDLSQRFDVSTHLVARSFADYHPGVCSVSLLLTSQDGPRIQWSTDAASAQAAVDEITGLGTSREQVDWAARGAQALRFDCSSAVV